MKDKSDLAKAAITVAIALAIAALAVAAPAWAGPPTVVPEPSTLALFAAAVIAIMLAGKFKK